MVVDFWDRYSRGSTICHRWPTGVKLLLTLAVIIAAMSVPGEHWPVHGLLFCLVFAALSIARIPLNYLWHRWLGFLPVLLALTLAIPGGQGFRGGWDLWATISIRSILTFTAGLWLVSVTPFDRLLVTLRRCGLPVVCGAILAFMYRYSFVIFDELQRMQTARKARQFGRLSWIQQWRMGSQLVGLLLLRSLSRAERVYGAMCARGWTGEVHVLDSEVSQPPPSGPSQVS